MANIYYDIMDKMEKESVNVEYINGWACGYLRNPPRGEQFVTEAYEAGYADGLEKKDDGYKQWIGASA